MTAGFRDPNAAWNDPVRVAALRDSSEKIARASRAISSLLVEALEPLSGASVLDVACGPGDPTLELAARAAPDGHVIGVDPADGVLAIARERARAAGLENAEFRAARADALGLPRQGFHRIACRFGATFFDPLDRSLVELRRVLRPMGRLALVVWGPVDQPWFRATLGPVLEALRLPAMPAEFAVPFRFAQPGPLEEALGAAGFGDVRPRTRVADWVWEDTPEATADQWVRSAAYFRPLLDRVPSGVWPEVRREVAARIRPYYDGRAVRVPETVRLVTAIG